mmetsp:Transcript_12793/g.27592  ORF Transcript_12793/g.27592 Transcript_12793/m.27592 type:complete len:213 (+) Transcript_12793:165-803(+)
MASLRAVKSPCRSLLSSCLSAWRSCGFSPPSPRPAFCLAPRRLACSPSWRLRVPSARSSRFSPSPTTLRSSVRSRACSTLRLATFSPWALYSSWPRPASSSRSRTTAPRSSPCKPRRACLRAPPPSRSSPSLTSSAFCRATTKSRRNVCPFESTLLAPVAVPTCSRQQQSRSMTQIKLRSSLIRRRDSWQSELAPSARFGRAVENFSRTQCS